MSLAERNTSSTPVLTITDAAEATVLEARSGERDPSQLALFIEINGTQGNAYSYDIWFAAERDAAPGDVATYYGELAVIVIASSVEKLKGATLDVGEAGLVIVNPNTPTPPAPTMVVPESDLSSALELAVIDVLTNEVNPQIAMHGGRADLVAVDENNIAYLRLSGGCQGCGMAQVTLSQGIAVAIKESVPQIADIVDITSHGDGSNPYFESAKK